MSDIFPAKHTVFRQDMFITHHLFAAFPLFFVNKVADQKIKCIHTAGLIVAGVSYGFLNFLKFMF